MKLQYIGLIPALLIVIGMVYYAVKDKHFREELLCSLAFLLFCLLVSGGIIWALS